jgi:hypothetical protein
MKILYKEILNLHYRNDGVHSSSFIQSNCVTPGVSRSGLAVYHFKKAFLIENCIIDNFQSLSPSSSSSTI